MTEPLKSEDLELIVERSKALDIGADAVIATDGAGVILYWNDGAEAMYGWKRDEVLGRNIVDVTPTGKSRGDAERIMKSIGGGGAWAGRFEVRTRDDEAMEVDVRNVPVRGSNGRVVGVIGVSRRA